MTLRILPSRGTAARRRAVALVALVALALTACHRGPEPAAPASDACGAIDVERSLQSRASVDVILILREPAGATAGSRRARQDRVLRDLGTEFQVGRRFDSIPGLAGRLTRAGFARARSHEDVRCVQLDGTGSGA